MYILHFAQRNIQDISLTVICSCFQLSDLVKFWNSVLFFTWAVSIHPDSSLTSTSFETLLLSAFPSLSSNFHSYLGIDSTTSASFNTFFFFSSHLLHRHTWMSILNLCILVFSVIIPLLARTKVRHFQSIFLFKLHVYTRYHHFFYSSVYYFLASLNCGTTVSGHFDQCLWCHKEDEVLHYCHQEDEVLHCCIKRMRYYITGQNGPPSWHVGYYFCSFFF